VKLPSEDRAGVKATTEIACRPRPVRPGPEMGDALINNMAQSPTKNGTSNRGFVTLANRPTNLRFETTQDAEFVD
jgi:hypothetical protein